MESKWRLSDDEETEVKSLRCKMVKLFHPDRFADDPEKMAGAALVAAVARRWS